VPRLILINGLPSSGKSALGRRYLDDHQLALVLDIDVIRSMLGRSLEEPTTSGLAARNLARVMARTHLQAGHDVLVCQFLGRLDFVEAQDQLAAATGAQFVEIALTTGIGEAAERFLRRS
jgi:predicted kinase